VTTEGTLLASDEQLSSHRNDSIYSEMLHELQDHRLPCRGSHKSGLKSSNKKLNLKFNEKESTLKEKETKQSERGVTIFQRTKENKANDRKRK
jgi:hypothetical protein